jgi:hypothetical protein
VLVTRRKVRSELFWGNFTEGVVIIDITS